MAERWAPSFVVGDTLIDLYGRCLLRIGWVVEAMQRIPGLLCIVIVADDAEIGYILWVVTCRNSRDKCSLLQTGTLTR
jgi:hypothetical protein